MQNCEHPDGVYVVKWSDNKPITMTSTHIGTQPLGMCRKWSKRDKEYQEVTRPSIIEDYNRYMRGVDPCDRMLSLYPTTARTRKSTVRTFAFLIDMAMINSWLQYKGDCQLLSLPRKEIHRILDLKLPIAHTAFQP